MYHTSRKQALARYLSTSTNRVKELEKTVFVYNPNSDSKQGSIRGIYQIFTNKEVLKGIDSISLKGINSDPLKKINYKEKEFYIRFITYTTIHHVNEYIEIKRYNLNSL